MAVDISVFAQNSRRWRKGKETLGSFGFDDDDDIHTPMYTPKEEMRMEIDESRKIIST